MTFDHRRTYEIAYSRDRDIAPFFAGRTREVEAFDRALDLLDPDARAATFRIYQGAPGCGKTSLLNHLRDTRADDALFIDIDRMHLRAVEVLAEHVLDRAVKAGPTGARIASAVVDVLGSRLRIGKSGDAVRSAIARGAARRTKIVLCMDEAQTLDASEEPGLVRLHTLGLGVPAICLFAGLGTTESRISAIPGLSRLERNAVVRMGAMTVDECAESTRKMFDALEVAGDEPEISEAARLIAKLSYGWPQHLNEAQGALCVELLQTNGALAAVDADRVQRESDRRRGNYYRRRLAGTVLSERLGLTAGVVSRVTAERPPDLGTALIDVCGEEMKRRGLSEDPAFDTTAKEFAAILVERGVLSVADDYRYEAAIPSMSRWLVDNAADLDARGRRKPDLPER